MHPSDPRFLEFVRLFNAENFFEAHEVLEALWREVRGEERDFYQGLIQIAAAFVHLQKGTPGGAEKLYAKASDYLKKFPSECQGVDLSQLLMETKTRLLGRTPFPKIYLK